MNMTWFLAILFWNPAVAEFQVADGWYPIPMQSEYHCATRSEFVARYLPSAAAGKAVMNCIEAVDMEDAARRMLEIPR